MPVQSAGVLSSKRLHPLSTVLLVSPIRAAHSCWRDAALCTILMVTLDHPAAPSEAASIYASAAPAAACRLAPAAATHTMRSPAQSPLRSSLSPRRRAPTSLERRSCSCATSAGTAQSARPAVQFRPRGRRADSARSSLSWTPAEAARWVSATALHIKSKACPDSLGRTGAACPAPQVTRVSSTQT